MGVKRKLGLQMSNHNNYPPSPYPPTPYPYNPNYGYPQGPAPPSQYPNPSYGAPPASYPPPPGLYAYPQNAHYPPPYAPPYSNDPNYPYPGPAAPSPVPHYPSGYDSNPYSHHSYPPNPPQHNIQTSDGFQYGTVDNLHHQSSGRFQPPHAEIPSKPNDHSSHYHYSEGSSHGVGSNVHSDRLDGSSPSYPSLYPPIDQLTNMHLSDTHNKPSAPASPPGPSSTTMLDPSVKYHSGPLPMTDKLSAVGYGSHSGSFSSFGGKADSSTKINAPYGAGMQLVTSSPSKSSLKVLLLHGNLDIWVYEAKNLPNMDMFHKTLGDMFNKLPGNATSKITSDPYVTVTVVGAAVARTYVISNEEDPVWNQNFVVPVAHFAAEVKFVVKDSDVVGSQYIGTVSIPVEHIYGGGKIQGYFPILNASGKPCKNGAILSLAIQYYPIEHLSVYHNGVGAGPNYVGVPMTYFPLRRGGTVTLYQDAHVPDGGLPKLKLDSGMHYVHGKCWHDIFDAIRQARRMIYITGWSVWHQVRLVRDEKSVSEYTLGELLKSKSQEGVRVLLLVWDDPTSRSILGYKMDGMMATHDEETRRYFKHSSVHVLLCPRSAGKRHSWVKQKEVGVIYTHHQKTVIVDADAGNGRRRIISFVGGLDLCDGRYDTPEHSIFRTLQTVHSDDYHNPTFAENTAGCPREPWHDLHCRIDGPAAYDILTNFEERWLKASKPHGIKKLKTSYDDSLLRIDRMPEILGIADAPCLSENDPESWHVQVFRSIDSNSVKGFPKDPKHGPERNLMCGKNVLIDMSIHTAYVKAIRAAQHFIYIENQYFIGSSYNWSQHKDVGANNLIPMEIALKIAEKIRAHERFAAYIVIPMWPEGNPTAPSTQRILYWQNKTMQMMYETVYKALLEAGLETTHSPLDYLMFFCLGNRETFDGGVVPESPPAANTPQGLSRKNRRFMIYVHSKGMIVDDEYIIIGSANINQRSMEGTRDTEIAMGAYQPCHTWARKLSSPQGQIYGYRMSLWAEHLGFLEDSFTQPQSLDCVRRVRSLAEANWEQFASPVVSEMRGHLLKYPVEVDQKGKVKPLKDCEVFPDAGGNIVGSFVAIQENLTI